MTRETFVIVASEELLPAWMAGDIFDEMAVGDDTVDADVLTADDVVEAARAAMRRVRNSHE